MLFLAFSTLIEFICMVLYIYMFPKLPIVKHYYAKAESNHVDSWRNENHAIRQQRVARSKHGPCNQSFPHLRPDFVNISWIFVREHWRTQTWFMVYALIWYLCFFYFLNGTKVETFSHTVMKINSYILKLEKNMIYNISRYIIHSTVISLTIFISFLL